MSSSKTNEDQIYDVWLTALKYHSSGFRQGQVSPRYHGLNQPWIENTAGGGGAVGGWLQFFSLSLFSEHYNVKTLITLRL